MALQLSEQQLRPTRVFRVPNLAKEPDGGLGVCLCLRYVATLREHGRQIEAANCQSHLIPDLVSNRYPLLEVILGQSRLA